MPNFYLNPRGTSRALYLIILLLASFLVAKTHLVVIRFLFFWNMFNKNHDFVIIKVIKFVINSVDPIKFVGAINNFGIVVWSIH